MCDQDRCSGPDTAIRSHSRSESESSDLFPVALLSAAMFGICLLHASVVRSHQRASTIPPHRLILLAALLVRIGTQTTIQPF